MLPSHVQNISISRTTIPPRSLRVLPRVLSRSGSLPRRPRPYQQIRSFRTGLWSSYHDANFQKELRRRQRVGKHKHVEAIHRKLLWDRHFPVQLRHLEHAGLKGFMCNAWRGKDSRPGGRWINIDDLEFMKQRERQSNKKDSGIDDVEQSALDNRSKFIRAKAHIFSPESSSNLASWVSRPEQGHGASSPKPALSSSTVYRHEALRKHYSTGEQSRYEEHAEYEIDPITNRKVPKKTTQPPPSNEIPVKTFKGYRSQLGDLLPPKAEDRDADIPSQKPSTSSPRGENSPQPPNDNINHLTTYEQTKDFESTRRYDTFNTNIDYSDPVQQGLKKYDEQISKEVTTNSTTQKPSRKRDEKDGLEAFDEKTKNRVRQFFASPHEHAGPIDPVLRAIHHYNSFKDVNPPKATYIDKTDNEDKVLKARREYEYSDSRRAALRKSLADRLLSSTQSYQKIVATLRSKDSNTSANSNNEMHPVLKAFAEYETSMKDKKTNPREISKQDEIDPLLRAIREYKKTLLRKDASEPAVVESINSISIHPLLDAINEYERLLLDSGIRDGLRNGEAAVDKADNEYLRAYDAKVNFYRKPCDAGKVSLTGDGSDIANKQSTLRFGLNSQRLNDHREELRSAVEESTEPKSWAYLPQKIRDLFSKDAMADAEKPQHTTKIIGPAVSNIRSASDFKGAKEAEEKMARRTALERDFEATQITEADAQLSAERLRQLKRDLMLDMKNARAGSSQPMQGSESFNASNSSKNIAQKLTGNFVRDFPEEFQNSWTVSGDDSARLIPKIFPELKVAADVRDKNSRYVMGRESFLRNPNVKRVEPSLDRTMFRSENLGDFEMTNSKAKLDLHPGEGDLSASVLAFATLKKSKPSAIEAHTSRFESQKESNARKEQDKELVREVRNIYEDTYGVIDTKHRPVPAAAAENTSPTEAAASVDQAVEKQVPTVYRILAYDPTMQSISSAETTSVVEDSSGPLTPAEVLLRLSNPSKFFPHFEPLCTQGYEIASGSGDVLVFRKVRDPLPTGPKGTTTAITKQGKSASEHKKNVMNPIDGMTRGPFAATGDFASPTGFVNHDMPRGSEPPFNSNIDMRREEPVFSGKRNWQYEDERGQRKRSNVMRAVLLGAGWVAACSYAVGVVSEYFRTGGSDGQGPQGF